MCGNNILNSSKTNRKIAVSFFSYCIIYDVDCKKLKKTVREDIIFYFSSSLQPVVNIDSRKGSQLTNQI